MRAAAFATAMAFFALSSANAEGLMPEFDASQNADGFAGTSFILAQNTDEAASDDASDEDAKPEDAKPEETKPEADAESAEGDAAEAEAAPAGADTTGTIENLSTAELIRRHHEGDVALGVCGGRFTALMWFYQESISNGRKELEPLLKPVVDAQGLIKAEAERRATDDGVDTSVRVMNDTIEELWNDLVDSSFKDGDEFQDKYNTLVAGKDECLEIFFPAAVAAAAESADEDAEKADEDADTDTDNAESDDAEETSASADDAKSEEDADESEDTAEESEDTAEESEEDAAKKDE